MSSDRHQRKQELLIRLSDTRLNAIDEAESLADTVRHSFSWLRPVGNALTGKGAGAVVSLGVVIAGYLLARGVGKLFFSSSRSHGNASDSSAPSSLGSIIRSSIWSVVAASVLPAVKQVLQQKANRKISDWATRLFSR